MNKLTSTMHNAYGTIDNGLNKLLRLSGAAVLAGAAWLGVSAAQDPEGIGANISDLKTGYTETIALNGKNPHRSEPGDHATIASIPTYKGCPSDSLPLDSPDRDGMMKEDAKLRECNTHYQTGIRVGEIAAKIQEQWNTFAAATDKGGLIDKSIPVGGERSFKTATFNKKFEP